MLTLLQFEPGVLWRQQAQGGSTNYWIWGFGLVMVILLVLAVRQNSGGGSSSPGFSRRNFRKSARSFGLAEDEIHFLEGYARALGISNTEATFRNRVRLEAYFKDVYRSIEKNSDSEGDAEERKALLFAIRERLARRSAAGTPVQTTHQLGRNTPLSFITPNEETYPSVLVRSEPSTLAVEPVIDPFGEVLRFRRGTKLSCFFYTKAHQGYQFATRVAGFQFFDGHELMLLNHNDAVSALPSRQFQRRSARVPCMFFRVAVTTQRVRGKQQASARVETIGLPGIVTDLSAGGMAVQTANPLVVGDFIKVTLDAGGGRQSAFGKIIRVNRLKASGGIMHVQFVKISRSSLNAILSYVFGYAE